MSKTYNTPLYLMHVNFQSMNKRMPIITMEVWQSDLTCKAMHADIYKW